VHADRDVVTRQRTLALAEERGAINDWTRVIWDLPNVVHAEHTRENRCERVIETTAAVRERLGRGGSAWSAEALQAVNYPRRKEQPDQSRDDREVDRGLALARAT
jgi:hypothetical protein